MASLEVERKFLVTAEALPKGFADCPHEQIRQGYAVIGADGSEARLRDRAGEYTMTFKTKGGLSRGEWESPITKRQFDTWWPATGGRVVEKIRYTLPLGEPEGEPTEDEPVIELDIYAGQLMGLMTAEIEFVDAEQAAQLVVPDWFGQEVTEDNSFKNQQLALNGLPDNF